MKPRLSVSIVVYIRLTICENVNQNEFDANKLATTRIIKDDFVSNKNYLKVYSLTLISRPMSSQCNLLSACALPKLLVDDMSYATFLEVKL